ncbi:unnamed protein product [Schistosoma mattheei]|uniref:Uncharacterized protein n=1 Tax=Schistosoma mattheei TaxID=31246 RepID=A0A3P8B3N3_9TREM|nr:unnamed protein product [Schistosoma mattheei]
MNELMIPLYGVNDTRVKLLTLVKALPREFNRYVAPSIFTSVFSEHYKTLKRYIYKRGDLIDRQSLDQILNNIRLQHGSATDILQRMRKIIGQKPFNSGLFKQLSLSKLPEQVQPVLFSFQNNALDELAASADRILEITKSNVEVFSLKEKPLTTQNDVTELCHTLTRYLKFRSDLSLDHERLIIPTGTGIITSMKSLPEIEGNLAIFFVGSGAEVSVLPSNSNDRLHESALNLQAANGKTITIYGITYVSLNVGLRKPIHWIFVVADVSMPIININLLQHQNPFIDTRKRRPVDGNNNLSVCVSSFSGCGLSLVTTKHTIDPFYQQLLDKYPGIHQTQPK